MWRGSLQSLQSLEDSCCVALAIVGVPVPLVNSGLLFETSVPAASVVYFALGILALLFQILTLMLFLASFLDQKVSVQNPAHPPFSHL